VIHFSLTGSGVQGRFRLRRGAETAYAKQQRRIEKFLHHRLFKAGQMYTLFTETHSVGLIILSVFRIRPGKKISCCFGSQRNIPYFCRALRNLCRKMCDPAYCVSTINKV
jgi:hypothetical protein